jgi:hypothetical protein
MSAGNKLGSFFEDIYTTKRILRCKWILGFWDQTGERKRTDSIINIKEYKKRVTGKEM